jgi:hypothetical protein
MDDEPVVPDKYKFIAVDSQSGVEQSKNRQIARSHVMKGVRQRQKKKQGEVLRLKLVEFSSGAKGKGRVKDPDEVSDSTMSVPEDEVDDKNRAVLADGFLGTSTWASSAAMLSQKPIAESTISALQTYKGKVTPYLHQLIDYRTSQKPCRMNQADNKLDGSVVWPSFWPPRLGEASPLTVDWFALVRSHPVLFHATCYAAATQIDLMQSSTFLSDTVEIKMHKYEAIRMINEELASKGQNVHETVILSILCMIRGASDVLADEQNTHISEVDKMSPFKDTLMPMQW